jgi:hypothetical protein
MLLIDVFRCSVKISELDLLYLEFYHVGTQGVVLLLLYIITLCKLIGDEIR